MLIAVCIMFDTFTIKTPCLCPFHYIMPNLMCIKYKFLTPKKALKVTKTTLYLVVALLV